MATETKHAISDTKFEELSEYFHLLKYKLSYSNGHIEVCAVDLARGDIYHIKFNSIIARYFDVYKAENEDTPAANTWYCRNLYDIVFIFDRETYETKFLSLFGKNFRKYFNEQLEKSKE